MFLTQKLGKKGKGKEKNERKIVFTLISEEREGEECQDLPGPNIFSSFFSNPCKETTP